MSVLICSSCNFTVERIIMRFTRRKGIMMPDPIEFCPQCNIPLQTKPVEVSQIQVSVGRFDSMNDRDKKEVLQKRAKRHFDQYEKDEVARKRKSMIANIKQKFEEDIL